MCFLIEWTSGDTIALFSLIVSALTLWLGYVAYKKLLPGEAAKAQLPLMLKAIDDLNHTVINCYEQNPKQGTINVMMVTFFGYANRKKYLENENYELVFPEKWDNKFIDILVSLSDNPITPTKIREVLYRFRAGFIMAQPTIVQESEHVFLIGTKRTTVEKENITRISSYKGGMNGFFKIADDFSESIQEWLQKNGLKDPANFVDYHSTY